MSSSGHELDVLENSVGLDPEMEMQRRNSRFALMDDNDIDDHTLDRVDNINNSNNDNSNSSLDNDDFSENLTSVHLRKNTSNTRKTNTPSSRLNLIDNNDNNDNANNDNNSIQINDSNGLENGNNNLYNSTNSSVKLKFNDLNEYDKDMDIHMQKINYWKSIIAKYETKLYIRPKIIKQVTTINNPLFLKFLNIVNNFFYPVVKPGFIRLLAQFIYCFIWVLIFAICVKFNNYMASTELGTPSYLSCTDSLWDTRPYICGVNGQNCEPFNDTSIVFRCPTGCAQTYNINFRWVGGKVDGNMMPWIIGSNSTGGYRADSWICSSAIHAGVTTSGFGGCGKVDLIGQLNDFISTKNNGLTSMSFNSIFPKSYVIDNIQSKNCNDNTWPLVPLFLAFVAFFPFTRPSKPLYIFCLVSTGVWQIVFFGIPLHDDGWVSQAWGRYLVTLCFSYTVYMLILRKVIMIPHNFAFDYMILYMLPYYIGIYFEQITAPLSNFGFTSRAFRNTETIVVFVILVPIIIALIGFQLYHIRQFGKLGKYIYGYIIFILCIFILPKILNLYIHIHHYIMSLILFPITAIQTRASFIGQGFLLGMMVQGLTRWGPASPFDTHFENLGGDPAGTITPTFTLNSTTLSSEGLITWTINSTSINFDPSIGLVRNEYDWDSFSLSMNDVEVYRGPSANFTSSVISNDTDKERPYYLRLALVSGASVLDYSWPTVVFGNGSFYQSTP